MSVDYSPKAVSMMVAQAVKRALDSTSAEIAGDVEENALRKKTNPGPRYLNPSKPGNPPAVRTGNLARNMGHSGVAEIKVVGSRVTGGVFNSAPYAALLEFGTRKMAPRPFMLPTISHNADRYKQIMLEEIRYEVGR